MVYGDAYGDVYGATVTTPAPPPAGAVPRSVVQVGFGTDPLIGSAGYLYWSDPARVWDQTLWAPDDVWTDVTPWLQTWSFHRGANRVEGPVLRYEAGTATIVLSNNDGRFHPLNLAGPYVSGNRTLVRPMVPVRIGVEFAGQTYWQWTGFADSWLPEYPSPAIGRVTLTATDGQKVLGKASRRAAPAAGGGERSGARVHRILDSAGWPAADRVIAAGDITVQATTLEGDALAELQLVSDSELGSVYLDAVGRVVFKNRLATLTEPTSTTSQGVFGSDRANGELPYAALTPSYDDDQIRNVWRIGRANGTPQEARDDNSINEYLEATHERTDLLMETDAQALTYAQYGVAMTSQPAVVFTELAIDPRADLGLWPQVLRRDIGHRVTIRSRLPGLGLVERDAWVRGITAERAGPGRYSWKWQLQPASTTTYLTWDVGRWDQAAWAF